MNSEIIKISVVVLIYNVEDYVKRCIESIIEQSYRNLEIILVDDGATDLCPEICDAYARKDQRIRVIHKSNGGVVSARKAGVAVATGDYVLYVDGDDWIEEERIEVLVRDGILPTHADMILLSGCIMDFEEESIRRSFAVPTRLFENDEIENEVFPLLSGEGKAFGRLISWSLWAWAIRRELLLKNQMLVGNHVALSDDTLCVCLCLLDAKSVMMIQQDGYHYIQRASSIVNSAVAASDKNLLRMKILYEAMKTQLELKYASERTYKNFNHLIINIGMLYIYDLLLEQFPDYLFPFPKINSGARIVIYGAGRLGYNLVQNLDKTKKCSVVLWVDQNQDRTAVPGYTISPRETIFTTDYDYIAVALMYADVAEEVKRSLILDGIPEEKIATMDASVIAEDAIPDEIKAGGTV